MEKELLDFFKQHQIDYALHTHEPVFTTEQSNHLHETIQGAHSKNLFLKDKKKSFFMLSILDHKRVNLKALSKNFGKGGLSFASVEELMGKLSLTPGSVTPYALLHDPDAKIKFLLDQDFLNYEVLNFHPLRNDQTVSLNLKSFFHYFELIHHSPQVIEIPNECAEA